MKAISALYLLKQHNLIHKTVTIRELKIMRKVIVGTDKSWEDLVRYIMQIEYLVGKKDLTEPITIPEVQFGTGGTVEVKMKLIREEEDSG